MSEKLIQSVMRATDIMELFLGQQKELSVKEISEGLGLSKSTVHGIIKTLVYKGYLYQSGENAKYQLGMKLFELGNVVGIQLDITEISRPIIKKLGDQLGETIHLVAYVQGEAVYVEKLDGSHSLRIYSQVGKRAPLHCTGVGKAILAFLPAEEREEIIDQLSMERYTIKTVVDKEELKKQLAEVRRHLFAMDDEEIEIGLKCVASPIFNHQGKVVASISCATPTVRFSNDRQQAIIQGIKEAAEAISAAIGYRRAKYLRRG